MIEQVSPFDGRSIYHRPVLRDARTFHKIGIRAIVGKEKSLGAFTGTAHNGRVRVASIDGIDEWMKQYLLSKPKMVDAHSRSRVNSMRTR